MPLLPIEREAKAVRTRLNKLVHTPTCVDCGKTLSTPYRFSSSRCRQCSGLARRGKTFRLVLALRRQQPQLNATKIASQLGVSRERVRQILKKAGLPTSFSSGPRHCSSCGKRLFYNVRKFGMCQSCLTASRHNQVYKTFVCELCGQPFERRMSEVRTAQKHGRRTRWCSKRCQVKSMGKAMGRARWKFREPVEVV